jgi:exonuclease VII small subunit
MSIANTILMAKIERADAALRLALADYDSAMRAYANNSQRMIDAGKRLREAVAASLAERDIG